MDSEEGLESGKPASAPVTGRMAGQVTCGRAPVVLIGERLEFTDEIVREGAKGETAALSRAPVEFEA